MATTTRRRTPRQHTSFWRIARANLHDLGLLLSDAWTYLLGFLALVAISTVYFLQFATKRDGSVGHAAFHAFQLMIFQIDDSNFPTGVGGQILFFVVPLLGVSLLFQSVATFSRMLLDKSSRREAWQFSLASTYSNHVIVGGLGRLGFRVVNQLLVAGYQVVVITNDWEGDFVSRILDMKVPVIVGEVREALILRQAGVAHARAIIPIINNDLTNIEVALTARAENPKIRAVVRLFNDDLDRGLERTLQASVGFSTTALAAPTFATATSAEIDYLLSIDDGHFGITEVTVTSGSQFVGKAQQLATTYGVRVLQHQRPRHKATQRAGNAVLAVGDRVTLLGTLSALEMVRQRNHDHAAMALPVTKPRRPNEPETIIICGLGKVGYRVVKDLRQNNPQARLVVIHTNDAQHAAFAREISAMREVKVVIGDASDPAVLRDAGIEHAHSLAALTSYDLVNLQIGLAARNLRPETQPNGSIHLVLRVFSDALAEKLVDMFGIHTAYSTSALAAPTLAAAAILDNTQQGFCANDELFSNIIYTTQPGDRYTGRSIDAINQHDGLTILSLARGGQHYVLPPLDMVLQSGDLLALLGPLHTLAKVH